MLSDYLLTSHGDSLEFIIIDGAVAVAGNRVAVFGGV